MSSGQLERRAAAGGDDLGRRSGSGRRSAASRLGRRIARRPGIGIGLSSVIIGLVVWSLLSHLEVLPGRWVPSPGEILEEFVYLVKNGYNSIPLAEHVGMSLRRTTIGFMLGAGLGIPLGLVIGQSRVFGSAVYPYFAILRPIPAIALIPIIILFSGIGELSKVLVIFSASFLYITPTVADGARQLRVEWVHACQSLGASRRQLIRHVYLPGSMPFIMTGLKIGATISWSAVVAAELIAARSGLGSMVMDAATFYRVSDVYVGVALIGLIGFLLQLMISIAERRILHWAGKA
ncbi:ABC transporter permease [Amycolatopsis jejuensis]|uniref:ABC transporter permease n=1 Tax=Amycolatopsis jejuensis TaxID=330084 RepID=UPI000A05BBB2|nr:ABC transporter permease [Amycolatopsis jejuensis]